MIRSSAHALPALVAACLAAGVVPAAPQLVLPGKLDLAVAKGDQIQLCPDDGVTDTTPNSDCILGQQA